jgi:hypothetical protein
MFGYLSAKARVRQDHRLRAIRQLVDEVLRGPSGEFSRMYSRERRPSIAPEKRRALVLQLLYSVRSERLLMEEIDCSIPLTYLPVAGPGKVLNDGDTRHIANKKIDRCSALECEAGNGPFFAPLAIRRINNLRAVNTLNSSTPAASTIITLLLSSYKLLIQIHL